MAAESRDHTAGTCSALVPGLSDDGVARYAICRSTRRLEAGKVERAGIGEVRRTHVAQRGEDGLGAARERALPVGEHFLDRDALQVVLRAAETAGMIGNWRARA